MSIEAERPGDQEAPLRGGGTSAGDAVAALIKGLGGLMYSPAAGFQEIARVLRTSTKGPPGVAVSGPCR